MACKTSRVVLDTNAVLDWRLFGDPRIAALSNALVGGQVRWLATERMLAELAAVLARPLAPRWEARRERLLSCFDRSNVDVEAEPPPRIHSLVCSDPDDQMFLDLALASRTRWLVTRDRALLSLRSRAAVQGLLILPPAEWPGGEPLQSGVTRPA